VPSRVVRAQRRGREVLSTEGQVTAATSGNYITKYGPTYPNLRSDPTNFRHDFFSFSRTDVTLVTPSSAGPRTRVVCPVRANDRHADHPRRHRRHAHRHHRKQRNRLNPTSANYAANTRAWEVVEALRPGLPGGWCDTAISLAETAGLDERAAELLVESASPAVANGALATAEAILERARQRAEKAHLRIRIAV